MHSIKHISVRCFMLVKNLLLQGLTLGNNLGDIVVNLSCLHMAIMTADVQTNSSLQTSLLGQVEIG